jgi:hypothetical protein
MIKFEGHRVDMVGGFAANQSPFDDKNDERL